MMRTASGLVPADAFFRTAGGLVDCSSQASFAADYTVGAQTSQGLGNTGNRINRRVLTAAVSGGAAPFAYAYSITGETAPGVMSISGSNTASATVSTTSFADEPGSGADTATISLTVTDSTGKTATMVHDVTMGSTT